MGGIAGGRGFHGESVSAASCFPRRVGLHGESVSAASRFPRRVVGDGAIQG